MPAPEPFRVRAVLFDAVGTLIHPQPPAAEAYHQLGRSFGSRLDEATVKQRFHRALKTHSAAGGAGERAVQIVETPTSEQGEQARWRRVVADVFDDVSDSGRLFQELWRHFAEPQNWRLFDDVASALADAQRCGLRLAIASNFDRRLRDIWRTTPELQPCRELFCSSELGSAKPSPSFFRKTAQQLKLPNEQLLLVGDDWLNDYQGATSAGWHALLINRNRPAGEPHEIASLAELSTRVIAS